MRMETETVTMKYYPGQAHDGGEHCLPASEQMEEKSKSQQQIQT